jgi:hypothetical protein
MKQFAIALSLAVLSACAEPSFVVDAEPVRATSTAPDHFELPARFAVARTVYGRTQAAGSAEAAIWEEMANRAARLGEFTPLVTPETGFRYSPKNTLVDSAREQRYNYLLLVRMHPARGAADIVLFDTGSGAVMATAQAISPDGGRRGFWGGDIRKPARLERATLKIAEAAVPVVEELLKCVAKRQDTSG